MDFVSAAPTLLTAPAFVVVMLYISVVVGRRGLQILSVGSDGTTSERFIIAGVLGLGLLQFVPFGLAAFGILSAQSVSIAFALIAVASLYDLPAIAAAGRGGWSRRPALRPWQWAWLILLVLPVVAAFFVALAPSFDADGLGYHLTAPKRWLSLGSLDYLPTMIQTHGPMGTEMLFAPALAMVGDAGAKLLHFAASLLAAGGVFLLGLRVGSHFGGQIVGYIACTLFLYSPVGIYSVMPTSYAEGTATMALVASALCWMLWYDFADRSWLRASALLAGVAVSFKLTAVLFPVALAVLTALIIHRRGAASMGVSGMRARSVALLLALCSAPMVPWMIRSTLITGNPVFPVLAQWIPSKDFPAESSRAFESYSRYMIWGTQFGYDLSLDARKAVLAGVALSVLLCGLIVYLRQRDPVHRLVTLVLVPTIVVQLYAAGLYFRYWTPMAAVMLVPILALVLSRINLRVARAGLLVIVLVLSAREVRSWLQNDPLLYVVASVDEDKRLELRNRLLPLMPLYETANELTAPGEAVLMGYGCRGFYLDGPSMCAETLEESLRLTDWDDFNQDLTTLGIRYVILPTLVAEGVRPPESRSARAVGDLVRDDEFEMLSRLLIERGEKVATVRDQGLYRIKP